jgi:hypothetical protein
VSHTYLVECYWPNINDSELAKAVARARSDEQSARLTCSILIPLDGIAFCLFEADSEAAALAAARRAEMPAERAVEATLRLRPASP